jgi:FAD/FMN-containing dehydrogenase
VFIGEAATLQPLLAALIARAGTPSGQSVDASGYPHAMFVEAGCDGMDLAQCHLAGTGTSGELERALFTAKSAYLAETMTAAGISAATGAISELVAKRAEVGAALVFDAYGGAIASVPDGATAFVHRAVLFGLQMTMSFSPDTSPATVNAASPWLRTTAAALAPWCNGQAYQNYIDPTLANWQTAYYGTNLARLSAVKRAYDPDNLFNFDQSVPLRAPS